MAGVTRVSGLTALVLLALLAAAPAALAGPFTLENEGGPNADAVSDLYNLVMVLAIIVFVGVEGVLIWCLVKYRARKGAVAAQIHGNTRLEVGWTVGAALLLVFITAVTFIKLDEIVNPAASDVDRNGNPVASAFQVASTDQPSPPRDSFSINIKVDGQQYVWRYQYPGPKDVFSYERMVVPKGVTVTLDISSDDVQHSFWIPALAGKMDALPGYVNKLWFKATKTGVFPGQCAELCGRNHGNMLASVQVVETVGDWRRWYDEQARRIERARAEGAEQRQQLREQEGETAVEGSGSAAGASDEG